MDTNINDILNIPCREIMQLPFGEYLSDQEIATIFEHCKIVNFKEKEVVIRQGTPVSHVMYIKRGNAKIFKEGRHDVCVILRIEKAGNYLGLLSVFGNEVHKYSVSSVEGSEIGFIDINVFNTILQNNGKFSFKIIHSLSNYGLFIFDRLMSQSHKQLPGRVADVLLYFSGEIYQSLIFDIPFTRKELAELAGTTKESFIRTLTEFKNDKIIKIDGSRIEIISIENIKLLSRLG